MRIAALYVDPRGHYAGLPGVELWDEKRDARGYRGPYPVVAHPPCSRWCRLAGLVEARWGHERGEDGGCFEHALDAVRTWGGVLEHPAYTDAWRAYGLPRPHPYGGWQRGLCGGWVAHVEQARYGHQARKATWLYAYGTDEPPGMEWGVSAAGANLALVSNCGNRIPLTDSRRRLIKREAFITPLEFRDVLLGIARSSRALPWMSEGTKAT